MTIAPLTLKKVNVILLIQTSNKDEQKIIQSCFDDCIKEILDPIEENIGDRVFEKSPSLECGVDYEIYIRS